MLPAAHGPRNLAVPVMSEHAGPPARVGYNAEKTEQLPFIVLQQLFRLAVFLVATTLVMNVGSLAQMPSPPAKSSERLALQRGQEALQKGDIARARGEFENAVRLAPSDANAQR
jgi:hypothetical protein